MTNSIEKRNILWAQVIIILTGILLYANTFDVPFYLDDFNNISENSAIRISSLSIKNIIEAGTGSPLPKRPVANISFGLNYYFGGSGVFGYHLVNMVIHIITGVTLFLFFRLTFATPALQSKYHSSLQIAFWAAVLWLAHPIQTQSVTYIVQRMNTMAAMFYIIAFWLYVKARFSARGKAGIYYAGTAISWVLAMGCKEIAATLPFVLFLYEWIFFQKGEISWLRNKVVYIALLFILLLLLFGFYLGSEPWDYVLKGYDIRHFTLKERVLTQFRVVFFYISLLLLPVPWRFGLEHDYALSTAFFQPLTTFFSIGGIIIILVCGLALLRRMPLLSFSIFWFFGNLAIESSVIPLELVFEHRLYLPSMFFFIPVCAVVLQSRKARKAALLLLACCLVFFGVATHARNNDWRDPVNFWLKNINSSPGNVRAHNNLGTVLLRRGELDEARKYLLQAIQLNQLFSPAYNNLGIISLRQRRLPEAAEYFRKALYYTPNIFEAHQNLGGIYAEMGNYRQGIVHLREAIRINPSSAAAHNNLANLLQLLGKYEEAIPHYDEALKYNPGFEDARYNRQIAVKRLMQAGQQRTE